MKDSEGKFDFVYSYMKRFYLLIFRHKVFVANLLLFEPGNHCRYYSDFLPVNMNMRRRCTVAMGKLFYPEVYLYTSG